MIRAVCAAALLLALSGFGPAMCAISAASLALTAAKDIVGIDIALTQDTPGKTPVAAMIAPVLP